MCSLRFVHLNPKERVRYTEMWLELSDSPSKGFVSILQNENLARGYARTRASSINTKLKLA